MKKYNIYNVILLLVSCYFYSNIAFAQAPPQAFKYQSIVRNTNGNPMANSTIRIRATIHEGSITGASLYQETHAAMTNQFGLINLEIGNGSPIYKGTIYLTK